MDTLTLQELEWMLEAKVDKDKNHYELMAYAVSVGYLRTQSKKKIEMFPDAEKDSTVTLEERKEELDYLYNVVQGGDR